MFFLLNDDGDDIKMTLKSSIWGYSITYDTRGEV